MKSIINSTVLLVSISCGMLAYQSQAKADAVGDAFALCSALEATGLITECKVKGWGSTIDVRIDTSSSEARTLCSGIVEMVATKANFNGKWKLRILSPFSGDNPIATCKLL